MTAIRHTLTYALLTFGIFTCAASAQNELEFHGSIAHAITKQSATWDSGSAVELGVTLWDPAIVNLDSFLGVTGTIGFEIWDANTGRQNSARGVSNAIINTVTHEFSGDATLIPVGASIAYRGEIYNNIVGVMDAGVRYVLVDANMKQTGSTPTGRNDANGREVFREVTEDVDIDNGIIGVLSARAHFQIMDKLDAYAGLRWTFDLFRGDQVLSQSNVTTKNNLQAIYLQAGLAW